MNIHGKNLKTYSANIDYEMVDDILHFHNKGNLLFDPNLISRLVLHSLSIEQLQFLEQSDYEINPFHNETISCETSSPPLIKRKRSALQFNDKMITFEIVKKLLSHSFTMHEDGSRPYPSGGALYPVEVLCIIFSEMITNSPDSGIYHYRPMHNSLQPIKIVNSQLLRETLFTIEPPDTKLPAFALMYVGVLEKMLVKYRYRGYRYALMESGSMYHQADLIGQSLGLINRVYSSYCDHQIIKFSGIDQMNFIPFVMQLFGAEHEAT